MGFADDAGTGEEGKCHRSARAQNFERGGVLKVLYSPFSRTMEGKTVQPKKTTSKDIEGKTSVHRKLLNAYNFGPKRATAVEGMNLVF